MNCFSYAIDINIKRYQNLLETSVDETERRTIRTLLTEDKSQGGIASIRTKLESDGKADKIAGRVQNVVSSLKT
jgi:hypothetical protein